jgi:hypothetical protein
MMGAERTGRANSWLAAARAEQHWPYQWIALKRKGLTATVVLIGTLAVKQTIIALPRRPVQRSELSLPPCSAYFPLAPFLTQPAPPLCLQTLRLPQWQGQPAALPLSCDILFVPVRGYRRHLSITTT